MTLRQATSAAHEDLDRRYSRFDLGSAEGYGAFLKAHAAPFLAVESALEAAGAGALVPGWNGRRRGEALRVDLGTMHLSVPPPMTTLALDDEASMLGAIYVLEGSRLGGAMLIRQVGPGLPKAFLAPGNPVDWRAFLAILEARVSSEAMLANAVSAALAVFNMFKLPADSPEV